MHCLQNRGVVKCILDDYKGCIIDFDLALENALDAINVQRMIVGRIVA